MTEGSRSFEMSISRTEFLRLLPRAVGGSPFHETGNAFVHVEVGRSWQIALNPLPELNLGTLRLERHGVVWGFSGYSETEIAALVNRFELYFRRGGG